MIVFLVYATFNPRAQEPVRFTTLASVAYELRHRAEECCAELEAAEAVKYHQRSMHAGAAGATTYEVRAETKLDGSVIMGDDEYWTPIKDGRRVVA